MSYAIRNLTLVSFAGSFSIWAYTGTDTLDDMLAVGFFPDDCSLRTRDILYLNGKRGIAHTVVTAMKPITLGVLAKFAITGARQPRSVADVTMEESTS